MLTTEVIKNNSKMNTTKQYTMNIEPLLANTLPKIAPLWSLENFVAVNPYMGSTNKSFDEVAQYYNKLNGTQLTMPLSFYLKGIDEGVIQDEDLEKALKHAGMHSTSIDEFIQIVQELNEKAEKKTVTIQLGSDCAQDLTQKNWSSIMTDSITCWASNHFDKGIATWKGNKKSTSMFAAWKQEALIDQTPKIHGLKDFQATIKELPDDPKRAIKSCLRVLNPAENTIEPYLHALLSRVGGWSAYNAGLDWDAKLYGGKKTHLEDFLAILLAWELSFFVSFKAQGFEDLWKHSQRQNSTLLFEYNEDQIVRHRVVLQDAYDFACQRSLVEKINSTKNEVASKKDRPLVQAVFCIDVRSEVYRRNLEMQSDNIETLGFAGFFGFPINYVPIGHEKGQNNCPALIPTEATIKEALPTQGDHNKALHSKKTRFQLFSAWKSFRHGAVSCFGFVSPMGMTFLPKLFLDAFGVTRPVSNPSNSFLSKKNRKNKSVSLIQENEGGIQTGLTLNQQVELAKNALTAMSLSKSFAKLVVIAGHGSSSTNNPHATGYDCGACGGNSGEANAKVAAEVLNNSEVRLELSKAQIEIPDDTHFVAAEHDTTTDEVQLFKTDAVPSARAEDLAQLQEWLTAAGKLTRTERAVRMEVGDKRIDQKMMGRSKDWSQVRHEWGLAGCNTFVVAPRERTKTANLEGKSFLHSYDWKSDKDFGVLEAIMTAPMVVTNWINMQYYASTVDNKKFGSGNKTLHNITGGIGVLEGSSGDLRVGLPWQSVHDGENYQHLPQRLNVIIEAPIEAINNVLEKHQNVKELCDNNWIFLLTMDDDGNISHLYDKDLAWNAIAVEQPKEAELV